MNRNSYLGRFSIAAALLLAAVLLVPAPSRAQYIYLDTNGDGVHTDADVVNPNGPTHIDVWLNTNHDRDGSVQGCNSHTGAPDEWNGSGPDPGLDIFSYDLYLIADNGAVDWGTYQDRIGFAVLPNDEYNTHNESRISIVRALPLGEDGQLKTKPAGLYKVGSFTLTVIAGTPSIRFGAYGLDPGWEWNLTGFGTQCDASIDSPNTYLLSVDFSDADGAAYGGRVNHQPSVGASAGMSVVENQSADQTLTATDEDGQGLSFTKLSGPAYAAVSTVDPGAGQARGAIHLTPTSADVGDASVVVRVSDGVFWMDTTIPVTVRPPLSLDPISNLGLNTGSVFYKSIVVQNPTQRAFTTYVVSAPPFVSFQANYPTILVVAPGTNDAGTYTVTVGVTDGTIRDEQSFTLFVAAGQPPVNPPANSAPTAVITGPSKTFVGRFSGFDALKSSDPDGDNLTFIWHFGDGSNGAIGASVTHAFPGEGRYWIDLAVRDQTHVIVATRAIQVLPYAPARAFLAGSNRAIQGNRDLLVRVQPTDQLFRVDDLTIAKLFLSNGAGKEIAAVGIDTGDQDADRDGVADAGVQFAAADVSGILAADPKRGPVQLTLHGELSGGGTFRAPLTLELTRNGGILSAAITPNPFNPIGQLSFVLTKPGPADVRIFDISGRLAHHPIDHQVLPAGYHELVVGRGRTNEDLPSGIYFYRIETQEGIASGRFAIVR